jgi:hypothetical protein
MKKRLCLILTSAVVAGALIGASSASAATEFGSGCQGKGVEENSSIVSLAHGAGSPLPVAAPISGILTEWTLNTAFGAVPPEEEAVFSRFYRQTLNIYKPAGGTSYTVVAEAEGGNLDFNGSATYPVRIPVQAGDLLGLSGAVALFCITGDPADKLGYHEGLVTGAGSTASFEEAVGFQLPVVARIEPDIDGDGYGDETQDKCPQSAAYQTACPVVTIGSKPLAGKKAVTLYVSTSLSAPVGVTATVPLGKGKKATLTAAAQTVAPGTLTPFKLTLTSQVTKALKELSTKKSLTLSITASATNVTGAPSTSTSTVKLKGLAKPVHKKKPQRE